LQQFNCATFRPTAQNCFTFVAALVLELTKPTGAAVHLPKTPVIAVAGWLDRVLPHQVTNWVGKKVFNNKNKEEEEPQRPAAGEKEEEALIRQRSAKALMQEIERVNTKSEKGGPASPAKYVSLQSLLRPATGGRGKALALD
jgi:hypothetical protein